MGYTDIDEARAQHAALKAVFALPRGEWIDGPERLRVEELCRRAAVAIDDRHCREEMRIVRSYAAEIFSRRDHHRWESESLPGAEFLRLQILKALDSYHSRLYSIEAIRRAGAQQVLARPPGRNRPA